MSPQARDMIVFAIGFLTMPVWLPALLIWEKVREFRKSSQTKEKKE